MEGCRLPSKPANSSCFQLTLIDFDASDPLPSLHGRYPGSTLSVVVLAQGTHTKIISEQTRTVTVNAHGAMIVLTGKVLVGQLLTLRKARSGEDVLCRVAYVSPHLGRGKKSKSIL